MRNRFNIPIIDIDYEYLYSNYISHYIGYSIRYVNSDIFGIMLYRNNKIYNKVGILVYISLNNEYVYYDNYIYHSIYREKMRLINGKLFGIKYISK